MAATDVASLNKWSFKRPKKIPVLDFHFNMGPLVWKGKFITVELNLHKMILRDTMRKTGMTYNEAMDEVFEMAEYGENPPQSVDNLHE